MHSRRIALSEQVSATFGATSQARAAMRRPVRFLAPPIAIKHRPAAVASHQVRNSTEETSYATGAATKMMGRLYKRHDATRQRQDVT